MAKKQTQSAPAFTSFADMLNAARDVQKPRNTKSGSVSAEASDGTMVTIQPESFIGDEGPVSGIRMIGVGDYKKRFFSPATFARLYDPAVVLAAWQFMGHEIVKNIDSMVADAGLEDAELQTLAENLLAATK